MRSNEVIKVLRYSEGAWESFKGHQSFRKKFAYGAWR